MVVVTFLFTVISSNDEWLLLMLSAWTIVRSKKFKKVNKKDQLLLLVIHFTRNALDKKIAYKKRKLYSPAILKWDETDQIIEIT